MGQICTKSFVGWGFTPDPTGLQRSPRSLADGVGSPGKGKDGKEGKGGRGEEAGEGREGVPEYTNSELASLSDIKLRINVRSLPIEGDVHHASLINIGFPCEFANTCIPHENQTSVMYVAFNWQIADIDPHLDPYFTRSKIRILPQTITWNHLKLTVFSNFHCDITNSHQSCPMSLRTGPLHVKTYLFKYIT